MTRDFEFNVGAAAPPSTQIVQMRRSEVPATSDQALWTAIRASTDSIGFNQFLAFVNEIIDGTSTSAISYTPNASRGNTFLPFPHVESYRLLKVATEVFLQVRTGSYTGGIFNTGGTYGTGNTLPALIAPDSENDFFDSEDMRMSNQPDFNTYRTNWTSYLTPVDDSDVLPYFQLIYEKLPDISISDPTATTDQLALTRAILREKLTNPLFLELIWSYWYEEGMLVQTMNAISMRFQNVSTSDRDPLAQFELGPLRPINNLLWGYVQDEQHRLSLVRRAYEYDHHYGLRILGKALPPLRTADSRSKFLEAFHNLLTAAHNFMQDDDQTTIVADGFPVLNALKDVHMLLTQGMHNQYGDLPWTARHEMLMQQYILSRPEMREFLPTRTMVAYPEPWMDRVDAMKRLQGWNDVAINHFRDLAVFGEQLLLAIRFGAWSTIIEQQHAANWVRYWRAEIQGYIYSYRAVTGVDLATEVVDTRRAAERYLPPAIHIQNRLRASVNGSEVPVRLGQRQNSQDGFRR